MNAPKLDLGEMSSEDRVRHLLAALVFRLGGRVVISHADLIAPNGTEFYARPDGAGGALITVQAPEGDVQ